jgi:hypothetical protein
LNYSSSIALGDEAVLQMASVPGEMGVLQ